MALLRFKLYKYAAEKSSFETAPHPQNQSAGFYITTAFIKQASPATHKSQLRY